MTREIIEKALYSMEDEDLLWILRDLDEFDWKVEETSEMISEACGGIDLVSFYDMVTANPSFSIHDEYYGMRNVRKIDSELFSADSVMEVLLEMDVLEELLEYLVECYEDFPELRESVEKVMAEE